MKSSTIFRLTALWALCESGLGGWMHALHLPFTGLFVGGFAVLIISLLASLPGEEEIKQSSVFKRIAKATILVLLVKAAVSPQSPPPAYIAVAFQGFAGALFFQFFPFKVAAILLGVIAMVESALQRIVIATIIYGKSLWTAIDSAFNSIVKEFYLPQDMSFSAWVIVLYATFYAIWGFILGLWMIKLPRQISARSKSIYEQLDLDGGSDKLKPRKKEGIWPKIITGCMVLAFIVVVFLLGDESMGRAAYVVVRTIAVVALLIWVVNPIFGWLMHRWLTNTKYRRQSDVKDVLTMLPQLQSYLRPAFQLAKKEQKGFKRFKVFVLVMIVLSLAPVPVMRRNGSEALID